MERPLSTLRSIDTTPFKHLYPFESNFISIKGFNYHYLDEGHGDPMVMIHGNPTWSFYFRKLVSTFSSCHRVVVPDHLGCGLSDKPGVGEYGYRLQNRVEDIENLIHQLDIKEKITLVLHDWGGMIGMAYAVMHPERISRIIIMNTAAFFPPENKKLPIRLRMIRNFRWFAEPAVLRFNLFSAGAAWMAPKKRLSKTVRCGLTGPYNTPENRIATLKFVQDIPLHPDDPSYSTVAGVEKNLYSIAEKPMLILWGKHDFVFDLDYLSEWKRRFPNAHTHLFPKAGHYVLEDEPEKIIALIQKFIKSYPI